MLYVLDSNHISRGAIIEVLHIRGYPVVVCESLTELLCHAPFSSNDLALVGWQTMGGLMADEHRHDLVALGERVPLAVMVPRSWLRYLNAADLGVRALLPRPFDAIELLACIDEQLDAEQSVAAHLEPA